MDCRSHHGVLLEVQWQTDEFQVQGEIHQHVLSLTAAQYEKQTLFDCLKVQTT